MFVSAMAKSVSIAENTKEAAKIHCNENKNDKIHMIQKYIKSLEEKIEHIYTQNTLSETT